MRIAFMLTSLGIGGAERQVVALAERMRARGHAVMILVLMPRVAEQWTTAVDVFHLNMHRTPLSTVTGMVRAVRVLREFCPDILHCHNFHGNMMGRMLKLPVPGVRVISTIHNVYEGGRIRMGAYRLSDGFSRRTISVCEAAASRMIEVGAVTRRKCSVIANGIDASEFVPDAERRQGIRNQMGVMDEFIWMTTGRIAPAKDYENLLCAFAQLHAIDGRSELWIAGEGNGAYTERMHTLAIELGLGGSIRWLGLQRDIAALLDAADAFVLPSAWEGMPLALGEAMAMEKPLVATDVGGVRELVCNCGIIVPAGDSSALSNAMLDVTHAPQARHRESGQTARRRIVENFSMDSNAETWDAMYRSVLTSRG